VRLLLVESLVLAVAGAALGLLFARWGSHLLLRQLSVGAGAAPIVLDLSLDGRVLAFTAAMTVGTALVFGTAPAFGATQLAATFALRAFAGDGRRSTSRGSLRLSGSLVVAQVALSLVLVAGASLFVRTFIRLAASPLGFDADRIMVANINSTRSTAPPGTRVSLFQRLADEVAAVPGVAHAAGSLVTPVSGSNWTAPLDVAGAPLLSDRDRSAQINLVTPGWFATYGMTIVAGRDFDARDRVGSLPVAIVNEAFAARFFPGRSAIGGMAAFPANVNVAVHVPRTIIGVTSDAVYRSLREPIGPAMYEPLTQNDWPFPLAGIALSVRASAGSPAPLTRSVTAAITGVDANLAFSFRTLADQINASLTQERLLALLSGFFGALAMILAALGLYGVTAHTVNQRRMELGIRMALGAAPAGVVRLVMSRVAVLVFAGIVIGISVSEWLARFIASLLYGLEPRDPATLAAAAVLLAVCGGLAAWLPARRASRVDPATILRNA
jgi:predicted permease